MRATIGFIDIPVNDPQRAAMFFAVVFGWSFRTRKWSLGTYLTLEGAAGKSGCALVSSDAMNIGAPLPVVHLEAAELDACLGRVEEAGGRVVEKPHEVDESGIFARFEDSEGNVWGIWVSDRGERRSGPRGA